jgi:hypothetical protein
MQVSARLVSLNGRGKWRGVAGGSESQRSGRETYEFTSGTDDESTEPILRPPLFPVERLEERDKESERLSGPRSGCTENVLTLEGERDGERLDRRGGGEECFLESYKHGPIQRE